MHTARLGNYSAPVLIAAIFSLVVIWLAADVALLFFAGLLVGVGIIAVAEWVARVTGISYRLAVVIFLFTVIGLLVLGIIFLAPRIASQVHDVAVALHEAVQQARSRLSWLSQFPQLDPKALLPERGGALTRATSAISGLFTFISYVAIVGFLALYVSLEPALYKQGFLKLWKNKKESARAALDDLKKTLQWWLVGRLISMLIIAVTTTIGLFLLGTPLALSLGILAGILNFIPFIGPLISAVPAVLLGFTVSPSTALYVAILFVVIQFLESYLLDPYIEKKTVSLPPALTVITQLLLGTLFGFLGVLLSAPLLAACIVIVNHTYLDKESA